MLKRRATISRLVPLCAALPLLAACQAPPLQLRPVGTSLAGAEMNIQRADADYASARAAIERRDYAGALEWLQAARTRNPTDIRVLNAFGVVYDKLGRFDLSARYYEQALALDASSKVVIHNLAYSRGLQSRTVAAPVSWELADIAPAPQPVARPEATAAAIASTTAPPRRSHSLTVVNATGHAGGEQPVFEHLARLKWSLSRRRILSAEPTAKTVIRYAPAYRTRALKLARTLPGHLEMIEADAAETGLQLVLGADSSAWRLRAANRS
jgi:tetratricopeptide (TPR) repeat protein